MLAPNEHDFKKLLEALRDALPDYDHPHKEHYTGKQLLSLYRPCSTDPVRVMREYGGANCVCGHAIKYVYAVEYRDNQSIRVEPVGSKCITIFSILYDGAELWKILDNFDISKALSFFYTSKDICAKNGFTDFTLNYLRKIIGCEFYEKLCRARRMRLKETIGPWFAKVLIKIRDFCDNKTYEIKSDLV